MKAILLVPPPGDPHGLLAPGKCGARVPIVFRCACKQWRACGDGPCICGYGASLEHALVLAWDGEPVVEGLDRWWRTGKGAVGKWPFVHPSKWESLDVIHSLVRDDPRACLGGEMVTL